MKVVPFWKVGNVVPFDPVEAQEALERFKTKVE